MDSEGEEIEFDIMYRDQSQKFADQNSRDLQNQSFSHYFYQDEVIPKKQECPTGILYNQPYQPQDIYNNQSEKTANHNEGLFRVQQLRKKKFIQISRKSKESYIFSKKGNKRQTSLLNINFKTFLSALLKQYLMFTKSSSFEGEKIEEFLSSKANFLSFQKLYGVQISEDIKQKGCLTIKKQHDLLRKNLIQKLGNSQYLTKIIGNKKMSFENKISMIKFSLQIRNSCINPEKFNNWKTSNPL